MFPHPFLNIPEAKLETLNALQAEHRQDGSPVKVDLMVGVYRDDQGRPFVLPSVQKARQRLYQNPAWNHEYPSSHLGTQGYLKPSEALFFGNDSELLRKKCIASMQCLGASGACHMGALFLKKHYEPLTRAHDGPRVFVPQESWANHHGVFRHVGLETACLPWYSYETNSLDTESLLSAIHRLPHRSIVVLQTVGQNPTGCDPSPSDWERLAASMAQGGHLAFLDAAYPGFVTGDFEADCAPVRLFASAGIPILLAATYGKAFGLYGERVGLLSVTLPSADAAQRAAGQMKLLARAETGAQPAFGAALVETILGDTQLRGDWEEDLRHMADEMKNRRRALLCEMERLGTPGDWSFLVKQAGMFSYTGLDEEEIRLLRTEQHVYLQDTGRLSIAGLNSSNIPHVARSLDTITRRRRTKESPA